jgi:hypothetical protein
MRTSALVGLSVALLGVGTLANAGEKTIASPVMYLSTDQVRAMCTIRNVGKKEVAVRVGLFGESGEALPLTLDQCNGTPVAPGTGCEIVADGIANGVAFACSASAAKVKSLRGEMMLWDNASFAARSAPLK